MSWREKTKELLSLPAEAQVISVYEYAVPKKNKTHVYLRCEYMLSGKKRTKHIPRHMEKTFRKIIEHKERVETLNTLDKIYTLIQELKRRQFDHDLLTQTKNLLKEMEKVIREKEENIEM